jgi:hypothetical protein
MLAPVVRAWARLFPPADPWERFAYRVPLHAFGSGNQHDFSWYLEGESHVSVASIEDVQEWLLGCEYVGDAELFREADFWQHPTTFERLREGDCEDHALWAWRKLLEIGADVELIAGRTRRDDGSLGNGHVWLLLRERDETFVFEATSKSKDGMLRPLAEVRDRYLPSFGVDRRRERFAYNGYLVDFGKGPPGARPSWSGS